MLKEETTWSSVNAAGACDGLTMTWPSYERFFGLESDVAESKMLIFKWEFFNLADDPTQTNDLSSSEPDRLRNMQELWMIEELAKKRDR